MATIELSIWLDTEDSNTFELLDSMGAALFERNPHAGLNYQINES